MRTCEYVKPNGLFCGSPATRGRDYCHWHLTCVARRLRAEKQEATQDNTPLELPPLEDANSVQLAVMMVMDAMLRNRIGPRMSGQLLYALQIASSNLKQGVCFHPSQQASGEDAKPEDVTRCSSYDSLEEDYGIQEHAEQLQASEANPRLNAPEKAEAEQQKAEEEKELSEEEQFRRWVRSQGYCFGDAFGPGSQSWEILFPKWRREIEERKRHWDSIRHDLSEAANSEDLEQLKELVADCYHRAGLQYEAEGYKPAGPQKGVVPAQASRNCATGMVQAAPRKLQCSAGQADCAAGGRPARN